MNITLINKFKGHVDTVKNNKFVRNLAEKVFIRKNFLVIDIGNFNLKIAHFCPEKNNKIRLRNLWIRKTLDLSEQEKEKELVTIIKNNFSLQDLKNIRVFFILPENLFITRRLIIPSIPIQEIPLALKFKLKDDIALDIESTLNVWEIVGEDTNSEGFHQLHVISSVVPRENINKIVKLSRGAGSICYGIYSPLFLAANYFKLLASDENAGVLDLGGVTTYFMIFKKGNPLFLRNIPFSSNNLTKTIALNFKEYDVSIEEAEDMKKRYGLMGGEEFIHKGVTTQDLISCMRSAVEKLVLEIKKSMEYCAIEFEEVSIKKIYLLGAGSQLKELKKVLRQELNVEIMDLPFPEYMEIEEKWAGEEMSVYAPLFVSVIHEKKNNFLPKELRISRFEEIGKSVLKMAVPLSILICSSLFANLFFQVKSYNKRSRYVQMQVAALKGIKEIRNEIAGKERVLDELKRSYIPGDWVMKAINRFLPLEIILNSLNLDEAKRVVDFEGYLLDVERAEDLLSEYAMNLRGMEIFEDVNIVDITKLKESAGEKVTFKMKCKLIAF